MELAFTSEVRLDKSGAIVKLLQFSNIEEPSVSAVRGDKSGAVVICSQQANIPSAFVSEARPDKSGALLYPTTKTCRRRW